MIKRRLWIVLMCVVVLAFTGCGGKNKIDKEVSGDVSENEYVTENKNATEETQKTDNKKNDTTTNKNESTSNKNETTTKPSTGNTDSNKKPSTGSNTKPNTGSTGNTGSTNNSGNTGNTQNNSTSTTTQPSTPVHEHKWTEVKETVVVQEAWTEEIKAWRTLCNVCKKDLTDMSSDDILVHVVSVCGGSYANYYMTVDTVQHPAVTEEQVTGYKCECGATKGK